MPAFPQKFISTVSHWQQTNRGPTSLWNHGRDAPLPTDKVIDYVIIGAGVTGSSLAYHLSREGGAAQGKSIVILDAKDVASCASGRNGGHVPTQTWQLMTSFMAPLEQGGAGLTAEEVVDIIMFEQDNLDLVESLVKKEGIDADFRRHTRFEVLTNPVSAAENVRLHRLFTETVARTKSAGRSLDVKMVHNSAEAKKITRVNNALAVNVAVAGSWHPHRGVTAIMRRALESKVSDVKFFSWAPVSGFTEQPDGTVRVDCGARGVLIARNLIIATCAYTHHLLPELEDILTGYRLQAGLVVPPATYAGAQALRGSYAIEQGSFLIQTPNSGLLFGPYAGVAQAQGLSTPAEMYGVEDDSVTLPSWRAWLETYCASTFSGWGPEIPGEGLQKMWSGIICHSVDHVPLVGPVPGRKNVYLAAGYSGQGMALAINVTRGLASLLKTGQWDESVPRCFELTASRLERARRALKPREYPLTGCSFTPPTVTNEARL